MTTAGDPTREPAAGWAFLFYALVAIVLWSVGWFALEISGLAVGFNAALVAFAPAALYFIVPVLLGLFILFTIAI